MLMETIMDRTLFGDRLKFERRKREVEVERAHFKKLWAALKPVLVDEGYTEKEMAIIEMRVWKSFRTQ